MPDIQQKPVQDTVVEAMLNVWAQTKGRHYLSAAGSSMFPLIREGDRILVECCSTGIRRGDIIVFRRKGRFIAHRVLRMHREAPEPIFITKGDNALHTDPPIQAKEIVGRVLAIRKGSREISLVTPFWRASGRVIALSMMPWAMVYHQGRRFMHPLFGRQPNRLRTSLRQGFLIFFSLIRRAIFAAVFRWKT